MSVDRNESNLQTVELIDNESCRVTWPQYQPKASPTAINASLHRGIPEFGDLLFACRFHALLTFVVGTAIASILALVVWTLINPRYQAEALVRVRENENVIYKPQASRAENLAFFRSQAALVRSHQVLAAALEDDELLEFLHQIPEGDRIQWLDDLVKVEIQSGAEIISVFVRHDDPFLAQALCNAVTRAYLEEITHRLSTDRDVREKQLEQAAVAADLQLDKLWEDLNSVAQSVGADSAESMTIRDEMQYQSYREFAHRLQEAQLRGNQLRIQLDELQAKSQLTQPDSNQITATMLAQTPAIATARDRLSKVDLQLQQMLKIAANPNSPQIKDLADRKAALTTELAELTEQTRDQLSENLNRKSQVAIEESINKVKRELELNRSENEFLRERMTELNSVVSRSTEKTVVPLDMTRHAIDRQSRLADSLWTALQELRIEGHSQPRITLLSWSGLPTEADHSRQYKAAAVSGGLGWLLVVFLIGYVEWRDCRVRSPGDLVSRSRFPVYGTNSYAASQSKLNVGMRQREIGGGAREAAAKLFLRNNVFAGASTLMVTSCVANEARHLVSLDLVVLLGGFGKKVLLIDCDVDRAHLSHALGAATRPGMRQISAVKGRPKLESIVSKIIPTNMGQIDFLPIGSTDQNAVWIAPKSLRYVIEELQEDYDAIIVNGPSMLGTAEGALFAEEVDSSVFAVFVNYSRWNQLILCEATACQSGTPLSGSILHCGKGNSNLTLDLHRSRSVVAGETKNSATASEESIQHELEAMQAELHQLRKQQSDSPIPNQPKSIKHELAASNAPIDATSNQSNERDSHV
ncbi:hypothetical protein LOC67_03045 [Stieleria sp. JC731]|uniref:GumC family protein n=1 Tax=Pirellulaceae TaxID=2691357 RepID=UPI001E386928|nr:hypothetical protein [Stieleria sp. JC731]MCC9599523.1 hypothetical protein [Stieleria sp. JC731]